mmetsp:Transcript_15236/g.34881  ORF Transcript_15236/g.34881 Transcript_15236/m.34881 type:complete len:107 (-) Transcript_15236:179-499(-)
MLLFREIRAEPNRNGTVIRGLSFDRIWNNGTRNETLETMERGGVHTQQQQQQQHPRFRTDTNTTQHNSHPFYTHDKHTKQTPAPRSPLRKRTIESDHTTRHDTTQP